MSDTITNKFKPDEFAIPATKTTEARPRDIGHSYHDAGPFVEVDLAAIRSNYRAFVTMAPTAQISPVIKCDGYGLGAAEIAKTLIMDENCNSFFVAHAQEGRALRIAMQAMLPAVEANSIEIIIMHGPSSSTLPLFRDFALTPVLNSVAQAAQWASTFPDIAAALHIDTGMNRLGLAPERLEAITELDGLNITLVMSHLACAGDGDNPMNARQRAQFLTAATHFPAARLSLAASGGATINKSYHYSLIRLGISLYGCTVTDEPDDRLISVARLCAPILQVRDIRKGDTVGYDKSWTALRPSRIATVCIGYGDGYPRNLSNRGKVIIGGVQCPMVGRISMDTITVDITGLTNGVAVGDIAEFFGPGLDIGEISRLANTISYELLTQLGPRIERVYINQH